MGWLDALRKGSTDRDNGKQVAIRASIDESKVKIASYRSFPSKKYGTLAKYLGNGVSCKVYLYQLPSAKYCAVKCFVKKNTADEDDVNSILREIHIHNSVNDNFHIVGLIDAFKVRNLKDPVQYYMVLEYLPLTLKTLYEKFRFKLALDDRLCYFKQILNGVFYLQSHNIGHRDIKLDNCGIDIDGNIKIFDLGSSTIGNIGYGMAGSLEYCAPEIHANLKYDSFKCDVWSLGIVLINLVYLTKQKWLTAKYNDANFVTYKENSTIDNIIDLSLGATDTKSEIFLADFNNLILQLLTIDVTERITLRQLIDRNDCFKKIKCCRDDPLGCHHGHLSLLRKLNS